MQSFLAIVTIFKNESHLLIEWLEHYLREGVDHFYMVDHGSTDSSLSLLRPYRDQHLVEVVRDPRPYDPQAIINQVYMTRVQQETQWVLVVELDQFIYSRPPYATVAEYLRSLPPTVGQICIPSKIFGSSGALLGGIAPNDSPSTKSTPSTKPSLSPGASPTPQAVDLYVHRALYPPEAHARSTIQSIVRTSSLAQLGWHRSQLTSTGSVVEITSDQLPLTGDQLELQAIDETRLSHSALHCNHYVLQAFETFQRVKMSRDDLTTPWRNRLRNYNYYNLYDQYSNQQEDRELQNKTTQLQVFYGCGCYREVTHQALKLCWSPTTCVFHISPDLDFNHCFGDPAPRKEKHLAVRHGAQLIVYQEHRHGHEVAQTFPRPLVQLAS